jgi:hypothetical protein
LDGDEITTEKVFLDVEELDLAERDCVTVDDNPSGRLLSFHRRCVSY